MHGYKGCQPFKAGYCGLMITSPEGTAEFGGLVSRLFGTRTRLRSNPKLKHWAIVTSPFGRSASIASHNQNRPYPLLLLIFPSTLRFMVIPLPAEIRGKCIGNGIPDCGLGGGDVMFVAVFANELEQLLELRHFNDPIPAER